MVSKKMTIQNSQGLHMRPAGIFTKEMTKFNSEVFVVFQGNKINGKSIMNVIGAGIKCGSEVEIQCDGPDEKAALQRAEELIQSGLGEE